jgi:hypothetical protein
LVHEKAKRQGVERQLIGSQGKYEVWLGALPEPLPGLLFEPYLYNLPRHLATQRPVAPLAVWLRESGTGLIQALLGVDASGPEAVSLPNAPFGGLQFTSGVPSDALLLLLSCLERWCREQACTRLILKAPAACYGTEAFDQTHRLYLAAGFAVAQAHANHHIAVTERSFGEIVTPAERRRLRKCQRAGFRAGLWHNPEPTEVYHFLRESRGRLGYSLPMGLAEFRQLLCELPDEAPVFVVRDGHKPICLTVAIRVNSHSLYNFCPADDLAYRTYSPTVLLNATLYAYARQQGISLLDLGTSLDSQGEEKASLARFKENLGGQRSVKITYEKIFKPH